MKYCTNNELEHFSFAESYIAGIQKRSGSMVFTLDNVTILPENSCNRDIRGMRTNGLELTIRDGKTAMLIEEGYKVYNADGVLTGQYEDREIAPEQYNDTLKQLADGECSIYSLEKTAGIYTFQIDASNDRTYVLQINGTGDTQEWDRFLNK